MNYEDIESIAFFYGLRCDIKYLRKFMRYRVGLLRIGETLGVE